MRIGQVNKDNYAEYMKMFGGGNSKFFDKLWGKDKKATDEMTEEDIVAMRVKSGRAEDGMYIGGSDKSWQKIVPVSDEIKDKLIETVRRQFMTNANGMGTAEDGDEIGAIMKEYRTNIPASERLSVTWTLSEIVHAESTRLIDYVKANVPGWQHGQAIPTDVLNAAISGKSLDVKV